MGQVLINRLLFTTYPIFKSLTFCLLHNSQFYKLWARKILVRCCGVLNLFHNFYGFKVLHKAHIRRRQTPLRYVNLSCQILISPCIVYSSRLLALDACSISSFRVLIYALWELCFVLNVYASMSSL